VPVISGGRWGPSDTRDLQLSTVSGDCGRQHDVYAVKGSHVQLERAKNGPSSKIRPTSPLSLSPPSAAYISHALRGAGL